MGNGTYVTSWGNYYSSNVTYTCNPGWYIDGPATKQCWDHTTYGVGEWPAPPACYGNENNMYSVLSSVIVHVSIIINNVCSVVFVLRLAFKLLKAS